MRITLKTNRPFFSSVFMLIFSSMLFAQEEGFDDLLFESSELLRLGKPSEALALLNQERERYGDDPEFLNNLAIAYVGNNEPDRALSILREIVSVDPMFSIVVHNLIEMELGAAGAIPDQLNPILFVQSVDSFKSDEARDRAQPSQQSSPVDSIQISSNRNPSTAGDSSLLTSAMTSVLQSWASAWSEKDFDRYVSHYANDFQSSDGSSRADWLKLRRVRLAKPGEILVTISNVTIVSAGANPRIVFDQAYQSKTYSDSTQKEMLFSNDNDRWKISRERTIKKY